MLKTADNKGRVSLGPEFANRSVIIERVDDTEVRVLLAEVVPAREAWLHKNRRAMEEVMRGLEQAKLHQFSDKTPDIGEDCAENERD
jgi:hypothetical protein